MLRIWMGRANTGKTARILDELCTQKKPAVLLVPEHASHTAELEVCRVCGPEAPQYAEVLSLRTLASRVLARTGGLNDGTLDAGGKLLLMQAALQEVVSQLTVYARPSRKAPFLAELVELCEELTACQVRPEDLGDAVELLDGMSGEKVRDLSLIYAAYLGRLNRDGEDRRDLMEKLLENLEASGYAAGKTVYLDSFTYFTAQELHLISILLQVSEAVTVTLLGDGSGLEIFEQSIRTRDRLVRLASDCGAACQVEVLGPKEPENALEHLSVYFFGSEGAVWNGDCGSVVLHRAETLFQETEYAAAKILELVRTEGCRFRDISVAARNLDDYTAAIENIFERYRVPVYLSRRSDVLEKPVLSLLAGALDAVSGGYEYEDMFRWLKTGLAGLTDEECDVLENYVIAWDIHGSMWVRDEDWSANPDGWQESFTPAQTQALAKINALRRRVSGPLGRLARGLKEQGSSRGKLEVLWTFLEELNLAGQLEERTVRLEELGQLQRAMEYSQLWDLLCEVTDQFADILGDTPLDTEEFARLLKLVLTQYDVGTIPAALDQVQVYQITRNDRSRGKFLILLGANDHVLPAVQSSTGLLTKEDREQLRLQGIELAPSGMDLFQLELENIYAALSQPTERLYITWPAADRNGSPLRPSFVVGRVKDLLPEAAEDGEPWDFRLTAPIPALELAGGERQGPLWRYFEEDPRWQEPLAAMSRAARIRRGRLTPQAVETLYGRSYRMSASRIDKINSCHFAYFMQYGLRAKERTPARFDAAQVGTFLHYVLEHVTKKAMERGGFAQLEPGDLEKLLDQVVEQYMAEAMPGFERRENRFKYLFRRLRKTVGVIVENVAEELTESDFIPLEFELGFGDGGRAPAITIHAAGADLTVVGKVDRVDGWLKNGRLYLRVIDYKSGRKSFDLSDVCRGLNIQMLLYLHTLEQEGQPIFDQEIVPAGVLYLPARDVLVSQPRDVDAKTLRAAMDKELRRSGMVLSEPEVLRAMEHSALENPRFLPLSLGRDGSIAKGVATAAELGKLGRYVDCILARIAKELRRGNIDADPCGYSEQDNACTYCEFASACNFMDGDETDHLEIIRPVTPQEFWAHVNQIISEQEEEST